MSAPLKPCPFCGAGQTDIVRYNQWQTTLKHWCEKHNYPSGTNTIELHGVDRADVIAQWNRRVVAS